MAFSHQKIDLKSLFANELPGGALNCVNTVYTLSQIMIPGTLNVFLGGRKLIVGKDYTVGVDLKSFSLIIDPNNHRRLNEPPDGSEDLEVSFIPD